MVHPLMRSTPSSTVASLTAASADTDPSAVAKPIIAMLSRLHVLVIGPGLGRDSLMQDTVSAVIRAAREQGMPLVLDADALLLVQKDPGLVKGYAAAVLTPNVVEFGRLVKALGIEDTVEHEERDGGETKKVEALATALGGVTIIQKGEKDYISNGKKTLVVDLPGGKKRSGGQGDTLTGCIGTFLAWRKAYHAGLWDAGGRLTEDETFALAAFGGSAVTRVSCFIHMGDMRALKGTRY